MNEKTLAKFFYQQCAGTTSGHMANVPNNPTLFSLTSAYSEQINTSCVAASEEQFAKMLREMADALDS
jgi:hypothetical protein